MVADDARDCDGDNDVSPQERELVVEPAVEGLINVLETVDRCPTVKRVVITSSVTAVVGDHGERGPGHIYTEADWNLTSRDDYCPYHRC